MNEKLKEIFLRYCEEEVGEITEDTLILRDLGLNSYSIIEIINDIEDEFEIEISDSSLQKIKTVGDLLNIIG